MLDYYEYSTREEYAGAFSYIRMRKFLLTQVFELRMLAIKESIVANYLITPSSPHYVELGYSLDNIARLFRLELVSAWEDGEYQDWAIRVGISTKISGLFQ